MVIRKILCSAGLVALGALLGTAIAGMSSRSGSVPVNGAFSGAEALTVARNYLGGLAKGELDQLDELFLDENWSSIFENSSHEGSWLHYKETHLQPELTQITDFEFQLATESVDALGNGFLVSQTGSASIRLRGEPLTLQVAVSYVIVAFEDRLGILHMHWSSGAHD